MLLSFVLFLVGILTTNNRTRKNISSLFAAILSFIFLFLSVLYIGADYFTDEGINDAVIYHVLYGVEDAGIAEYYLIIVIVFVLFLLSFVFSYFHYRIIKNSIHPKPKKIKAIISKTFLLAALIFHPTIDALWNLYQYDDASHNDSEILELKEDFSDHYHTPQVRSIGDEHPNLIYIYAESLEITYFDEKLFPGLITGLRELETNNTSFLNIEQVSGTGWTVAGMVASQCGLPLVTPSGGNSMSGMDTFYSGATCIGDLLHNEGYYLSMMQGSSIKFSGLETFYNTHNFDKIEGRSTLVSRLDDETYLSHWGLYDDSLFDIAFERFGKLSNTKNKFGLFLATIDTHHPKGHLSKECENLEYQTGSNPILNAVHCSDFMISNFVRKIQDSPYGNNTVIIISSDHLAMRNTATDLLNKGNRKNMFIVIDPNKKITSKQVLRTGSMLDIGPTLFHVLGFQASLGLGRNLLSEDIPLISKIENFNWHLKSWRSEISKFWNFKKIDTDIQVSKRTKRIYMGDRNYQFPILLKLDKELSATPFFEFDSQKKLYQQLIDFNKDDLFVWVDECSKINAVDHKQDNTGFCFLSGILGGEVFSSKLGNDKSIIPLNHLKEISKKTGTPKLFKKRNDDLLKLEDKLKVRFHDRVINKLTRIYRTLRHYMESLYRNLVDVIAQPSKIEQANIFSKNKKLYQEDKDVANRFIAHAGGEIKGNKYTDSLEALNHSYKKGFRLFELDIIKTKDDIYVAAHDWEHWSNITNYKGTLPPTLREFKKHKIKNKFTPLDINDINHWFNEHPDAILITDKINTPLDFSQKFIDKNRLMMELFTWKAVNEGVQANIKSAMPNWNVLSNLKGDIVKQLVDLDITDIAASRRVIRKNKNLIKNLQDNGIRIYVFHVNFDEGKDETYVVCNELNEIYGLYADKWDFNSPVHCD